MRAPQSLARTCTRACAVAADRTVVAMDTDAFTVGVAGTRLRAGCRKGG